MTSQLLYNDHKDSYWLLWQISIGSMVLCCAVFLGLKFKWFRAQLKMGESNTNSPISVQGVGFRFKNNSDDFQLYKVTSEFASPVTQIQHEAKKSYANKTPNVKQVSSPSNSINNKNIIKKQISIKGSENSAPKNIVLNHNQSFTTEKKNFKSNNFASKAISNPGDQKYSDLINKKSQKQINQDTVSENHYENQKNKLELDRKQPTNNNKSKNPLAAQNIVMPTENEDEWKIQIVDDNTNKENDNNKVHLTDSNLYSSQAASIFFAGKAPVAKPRPRKFVEMEEDNISLGSQTSA